MNQRLTKAEIDEIKELCFQNPVKACAVAQKNNRRMWNDKFCNSLQLIKTI